MKKLWLVCIISGVSVMSSLAEDIRDNSLQNFVIPDLDPEYKNLKQEAHKAFCERLKKGSIVIDKPEASEILFSLLAQCKSL